MDTHSQNSQRRTAIWNVALWSMVPVFTGALTLLFSYETIGKLKSNTLEKKVEQRDSVLSKILPENKLLVQKNRDILLLYSAFIKTDGFIKQQKERFLTFDSDKREQLETEIEQVDVQFELMLDDMIRLNLNDTLAINIRQQGLAHYALIWRQAKQDALSEEEQIIMLETELEAKDKEIFDLREKVLQGKVQMPVTAANSNSTIANDERFDWEKAAQKDKEELRKQAKEYESTVKTQCWKRRIEEKKIYRSALEEILKNKKRIDSIVPEIKALIKVLNQEIEKMELNPEIT